MQSNINQTLPSLSHSSTCRILFAFTMASRYTFINPRLTSEYNVCFQASDLILLLLIVVVGDGIGMDGVFSLRLD